ARRRESATMARRRGSLLPPPGPPKDYAFQARATPPAPCFAIGLLTARTGKGLAAPFAGPPPGKSGRGPNPHSSMDKCCRRVLEPPDTGAISWEEIVGPVTGIVKDAGDEEAGQRLKAGATPWRDRDFATRPMGGRVLKIKTRNALRLSTFSSSYWRLHLCLRRPN